MGRINDFEPELELESDDELARARTRRCASAHRAASRSTTSCYESFALTREAGKRTLGQRHFDVQLIGGMVLHDGSIAEMKTGEGKTLTATLPVVLNALARATVRGAGQGRPPRHRQRLPGPPRRRVDEADLRPARRDRRHPPVGPERHRQAARPTPPTSSTAPTPSSASTTCATTSPSRSSRRPSAATASRSSTRSTTSSSTRRARR